MWLKSNPEQQLKTLQNEFEVLQREMEEFFVKLEVSPEELENYLGNPNNFTEEQWEVMQTFQSELEKKFEPPPFVDASKQKKSYEALRASFLRI